MSTDSEALEHAAKVQKMNPGNEFAEVIRGYVGLTQVSMTFGDLERLISLARVGYLAIYGHPPVT